MSYTYDRRDAFWNRKKEPTRHLPQKVDPRTTALAKNLEGVYKALGYDRVQVKVMDPGSKGHHGLTVHLQGSRPDLMLLERPDQDSIFYFGPVPLNKSNALVWASPFDPKDRGKMYQQVLRRLEKQVQDTRR